MPGPLSFEWQNPDALLRQVRMMLEERAGGIRRVPESAVRKGAFILLRLIQQNVPKRTSTLARSITVVVKKIGDDAIEGKVGTHLEYARYLEEGTGIFGPKKRRIVARGPYPLRLPQPVYVKGGIIVGWF